MDQKQQRRNTPLNAALSDWDEKFTPNGKIKIFSVTFITKNGEYIHLPHAYKTGLKSNMKKNDLKAAQPCDSKGNPAGHIYPIWIHSIIFYAGNITFNVKSL